MEEKGRRGEEGMAGSQNQGDRCLEPGSRVKRLNPGGSLNTQGLDNIWKYAQEDEVRGTLMA